MLTILHISDLHFGPAYAPAVGEALLCVAIEMRPDVIIASGDFTQRAKASQFAAARAFLDRLPPVPLVTVPGNHDVPLYRVWERAFRPYGLYRRYISSALDTVFQRDDAVIVALNTTAPWAAITGGRIKRWQLDFCADACRIAAPGAAKIVVAHHHFAPAPDFDNEHDAMRRAKEALDRFNELEVDLILGGHLHRAYIGNSLDVYPSTDRTRGIIIVQSGTTTSRRGRAREREKNSFNLITIGPELTRITHFMFFSESGGFAPLSRHVFPRRPRLYLPGPEPLE
ncbi:MAG TPA: metallophosphoesterase family protein [Pirellulales bacterium]|jgi:3',5'-cyclic AMP phosphodiesterase CpdA|nr:metallophosphoesterase family protein [Pirellulales bacterium]